MRVAVGLLIAEKSFGIVFSMRAIELKKKNLKINSVRRKKGLNRH